jgi:hypothetical protein
MATPKRPSELLKELNDLAGRGRIISPPLPHSDQGNWADQLPAFREILVILSHNLIKAQRKIDCLTWAIAGLMGVLVLDASLRIFIGR